MVSGRSASRVAPGNSVLRRTLGGIAGTLVLAVAAVVWVTVDPPAPEPEPSPVLSPPPAPVRTSGPEVLALFVPATGADLTRGGRYVERERRLRRSIEERCLRAAGRSPESDLEAVAEGEIFDNVLLPDIDRMSRTRQLTPGGPLGADPGVPAPAAGGVAAAPGGETSGRRGSREDGRQAAVDRCARTARATVGVVDDGWRDLGDRWQALLLRIQASPELEPDRRAFQQCLRNAGHAVRESRDFGAFMDHADAVKAAARDTASLLRVDRELARVFVTCGGGLVRHQEALQVAARERFLAAEHRTVADLVARTGRLGLG